MIPERSERVGVVLAAGFGSRLRGTDAETFLKPLTRVGGVPLLLRVVRSLEVAGCTRVVVVTGFGAPDISSSFRELYQGPAEVIFTVNRLYELANGLSVLAARPHVAGDFVLMMADHVVGDEVMAIAGAHCPLADGATLLVDHKLDTIFDMDDATKVLADGAGRIQHIGKQIERYNCVDTGVFVCTQALMDAIDRVYHERGDASLSDGVQALSAQGTMRVVDIGDGFWQDVDTPEMLGHAEVVLARRAAGTLEPLSVRSA